MFLRKEVEPGIQHLRLADRRLQQLAGRNLLLGDKFSQPKRVVRVERSGARRRSLASARQPHKRRTAHHCFPACHVHFYLSKRFFWRDSHRGSSTPAPFALSLSKGLTLFLKKKRASTFE